ncbi:MAG: hypothetical protein WBX15_17850 [Thermoanaerobaculia bacterium]
MQWFNLSLVGWILLVVALAIAAHLLGASPIWIGVGALALIGIGVIVSASRHSGPPGQTQ